MQSELEVNITEIRSKVNIKCAIYNSEIINQIIDIERRKHTKLKVESCTCIVCEKKRKVIAMKLAVHRVKKNLEKYYEYDLDRELYTRRLATAERELELLEKDLDSWSKLFV